MVTVEELTQAAGKVVASGPQRFERVAVDSRRVEPGDLFVALRGERTDGHAFVHDAFARGAGGALVREVPPSIPGGRTVVQVTDPARTLWTVAERRRQRTPLRMVGITGSVGKTTTKEWTAHLLATTYRTFKTQGNYNTDVGLPLSLLELTGREEAGVAELAMRGPGEIRMLAELARPQVGVITHIGESHIGRLGSREAIAKAKAELFEALPHDGVAILPGDEPFASFLLSWAACEAWTVGQRSDDTVQAQEVQDDGDGVSFLLVHAGQRVRAHLRLKGRHFLTNALLAVAAARALQVPLERIAQALEELEPLPGRARVVRQDDLIVLDDSYNASPSSLQAALEVLASLPGEGRRVAVLGEMRELGTHSRALHRESGQQLARSGVDVLVAVGGEDARVLAEAAKGQGGPQEVHLVADAAQAQELVARVLRRGDRVLVKGSRALGLEQVVAALTQWRPVAP